jgi:hypothetical protein
MKLKKYVLIYRVPRLDIDKKAMGGGQTYDFTAIDDAKARQKAQKFLSDEKGCLAKIPECLLRIEWVKL